jgi:hypothetical protein
MEYFKNLYSHKLENAKELGKFLDIHDSPKLNQDVIKNLNLSIKSNEIETVIKNLSTKKSTGPDEFYQTFKGELIPMLLKLVHKIQKEVILPNTFYEASITLIPKPGTDASRKTYP